MRPAFSQSASHTVGKAHDVIKLKALSCQMFKPIIELKLQVL